MSNRHHALTIRFSRPDDQTYHLQLKGPAVGELPGGFVMPHDPATWRAIMLALEPGFVLAKAEPETQAALQPLGDLKRLPQTAGSALAEALLMAIRITKRKKVAISSLIHPLYRRVVKTYFEPTDFEVIELPYLEDGMTDIAVLEGLDDLAAVAVQSPNFLGSIENLKKVGERAHEKEALCVTSFTEPLAYGLLKNPGSQGAEIACGEGQSLGIPQSFGGPRLGMFASKMKYVRSMPGRLVGKTTDMDGKRGFVLTLATREQHIRRGKATSNICTNNNLCALAAAMYMASIGGTGIRELARLNHDKAEYLKSKLKKAGFKISFDGPTFYEFVVEFPAGFETTYKHLVEKKMIAGIPLAPYYPELADHYLLCVTETSTKNDMDALVKEVKS